jgi:FAD/FMN-containing dehydrogenase
MDTPQPTDVWTSGDAYEPYGGRWSRSPSAAYVNNLGTEGEDRIREGYGANYDRLAAIKTIYDPTNLFRSNQNIRPPA